MSVLMTLQRQASGPGTLGGKVLLPASPELREDTMAVVMDPWGAIFVLQKGAK
jgi:hypothetical protein